MDVRIPRRLVRILAGLNVMCKAFIFKWKKRISFRAAGDPMATLIQKEGDKKADENQADEDREQDDVHWGVREGSRGCRF